MALYQGHGRDSFYDHRLGELLVHDQPTDQ